MRLGVLYEFYCSLKFKLNLLSTISDLQVPSTSLVFLVHTLVEGKDLHQFSIVLFPYYYVSRDIFFSQSLAIFSKKELIIICGCSFGVFWLGMDQNSRRRMSREKMDVILKGVVKQFFIDKEVTSTLVMDSLYSGLKALESQTKNKKARSRLLDAKELPAPVVSVDKDMFVLVDDVLSLLERVSLEPLPPPKDGKGPQNRTKVGFMGCIYIYFG